MKNLVTNGFGRKTVGDLVAKTNHIVASMTANPTQFPEPDPSLGAVQTARQQLESAALEASTGDRTKILVARDKKAALVSLLQLLGVYVNLRANGDRTIATLSGFTVRKEDQPAIITYVDAPVCKQGLNRDELEAQTTYIKGAKSYVWYITADATQPIESREKFTESTSRTLFTNRLPGTTYYVVVAAVGPYKQRVYSAPSTYIQ